MDRQLAEAIAKSRGGIAVLVNWCGEMRWHMLSLQRSSVESLAQSASSENWEEWTSGNIGAFDATGQPLVELDGVDYDWEKTPQPIEFRRMAWHVCFVHGVGRLTVKSQHATRLLAENAAKRLQSRHYTTRIRWLPIGCRGAEIVEAS